jgi:hypothetical protein
MSSRERYHCMISTCDWHYERDGKPTGAELERALMFGPADASLDRAARTNAILREHFETHTLEEWVAEVSRERRRADKAEKELAEVRALMATQLDAIVLHISVAPEPEAPDDYAVPAWYVGYEQAMEDAARIAREVGGGE